MIETNLFKGIFFLSLYKGVITRLLNNFLPLFLNRFTIQTIRLLPLYRLIKDMEVKMYYIIDRIGDHILTYHDEMEFGFSLDQIVTLKSEKYPFLKIVVRWYNHGKVAVIRENDHETSTNI